MKKFTVTVVIVTLLLAVAATISAVPADTYWNWECDDANMDYVYCFKGCVRPEMGANCSVLCNNNLIVRVCEWFCTTSRCDGGPI